MCFGSTLEFSSICEMQELEMYSIVAIQRRIQRRIQRTINLCKHSR